MKTVIALSLFLNKKTIKDDLYCYKFHFIGVYKGIEVKWIEITSKDVFLFDKGREYLLYFILNNVKKDVISGSLLKIKYQ